MEANRKEGHYAPKWRLVLEFWSEREQKFWDEDRLEDLIWVLLEQYPWKDKHGNPLNKALEIHVNLASQVHPDYGPETTIIFMHGNLLLSAKQLWAYEKWARRIGDQLKKRIIHISDELSVSTLIVFKMSIDFSSSL